MKPGFVCVLAVAFCAGAAVAAGPDVIVGDLSFPTDYARLGDTAALAIGTTSCNSGDEELNWYALPSNQHPVIAQNFYRLKDGRLEQIGMAWLKHGFTALQGTVCYGDCQPAANGTRLGIHCSDPYGAGLNSGPDLGPRSEVDPVTGYYDGATANDHTGHTHTSISHGLQVKHADLGNAGARYFFEGQYVSPDDATSGNGNNNASYREYSVTGSSANWSFANIGSTVREQPAINAWPGATQVILDSWPSDGRLIVAYQVTDLGGGQYHYEYAVYNMNSRRGVRSFRVPVGSASVSNIGFHAAPSHDEGFSNDPWTSSVGGGTLEWYTDKFSTDPNANAIRWGMMYNFWFDANAAPVSSQALVERFQPGLGPKVLSAAVMAPAALDCDGNTIPDSVDIAGGAPDCNANGVLDTCELSENDCNADNVPDDCQAAGDCNGNGQPDICDAIANDCDGNNVPDDCQNDCDRDGTIDACAGEPDCNANAIPDSCDISGVAGGVDNYASGTINLPILDFQTTTHTINATQFGELVDVNVQINLTHTYDADLTIRLEHGATTITLAAGVGGSGDNFQNTIFDDEAATAIAAGAAPFAGTYRPEEALSAFDGQDAAGDWTLTVYDAFGADQGTLIDWNVTTDRLSVPPVSDDANTNNVPDECECGGCKGDMNGNHQLDGGDISLFVQHYVNGPFEPCADITNNGPELDETDVVEFTNRLLNLTGPCP